MVTDGMVWNGDVDGNTVWDTVSDGILCHVVWWTVRCIGMVAFQHGMEAWNAGERCREVWCGDVDMMVLRSGTVISGRVGDGIEIRLLWYGWVPCVVWECRYGTVWCRRGMCCDLVQEQWGWVNPVGK
jgi:hypothetical protein